MKTMKSERASMINYELFKNEHLLAQIQRNKR